MPAQLYDTESGATYLLDPGKRFIIGRSATPRAHLDAEPGERGVIWYVCDRGATNGTFLNGEKVAREALRTGDVTLTIDAEQGG